MGFWSTLGWVAAGVGAVAVAPMTGGGSIAALVGATGTLTAGGAALGAATGATVASLAAPDDDDVAEARSRGEESGKKAGMEAGDKKLEEFQKDFEARIKRAEEAGRHYELILALEAVGMACAACDGEIAPEEKIELDEFVAGASKSQLPENVKKEIYELAANPPSMKTAFEMATKFPEDAGLFQQVIEVVMMADGIIKEEEKAFKQAWRDASKAA